MVLGFLDQAKGIPIGDSGLGGALRSDGRRVPCPAQLLNWYLAEVSAYKTMI
jgi:hypothetical protein